MVAHLTGKYNYEDDHHKQEVLDGARVGNTVYLAIRATKKANNRTFVFAAVLMISNTRRHGFGYKEQDEFMGPNQCACPARIMRRLSPISDLPRISYAAEWRARVAEYNHQKRQRWLRRQSLRLGSIVSLPSPARFGMGVTASRFRVARFRGRTPIRSAGPPRPCLPPAPENDRGRRDRGASHLHARDGRSVSHASLSSRPLVATRTWRVPADYLPLHSWFDASKSALAYFTHRALHHHREGIAEAVRIFGATIRNADDAAVSVEALAVQYCAEDIHIFPTAADWFAHMDLPSAGFLGPPCESRR